MQKKLIVLKDITIIKKIPIMIKMVEDIVDHAVTRSKKDFR